MKRLNGWIAFAMMGFCLISATQGVAQDKALEQLIEGKKLFWDAKFDQSILALRQVIGVPNAKKEYLFEAYLYMGFVLMRQNAASSDINNAFEQAVKVDPQRELDENIIPPDLVDRFKMVRKNVTNTGDTAASGCVYVVADPEEVTMTIVENDSVIFTATTPAQFCGSVGGNYQLLLTKQGYEEDFSPIRLTAGKTDTLSFSMIPSASLSRGGGGGRSVWGWLARGGIAVAAGAVLYKTVLEGSDSSGGELPGPPARPTP